MNNKERSSTICLLPVSSISIHATGKIVRCQMSETAMGDVSEGSIVEQWDNEKFQQLRQFQRNGEWLDGCNNCKHKEENGVVSKRNHWKTLEVFDDVWHNVDWNKDTGHQIYHLDIAFNNLCNFKCKMCSSAYSNAWIGDEIKLKERGLFGGASGTDVRTSSTWNRQKWTLNSTQLIEVLDRAPNLRRVEVLGGEPFLVPEFIEFLEILRSRKLNENLELMITTNGSVVTEEKLKSLEGFKYVNINLSLDGTGDYFSYMRSAGAIDWSGIVEKATIIKEWCDRQNFGTYKMNINGTYQAINALNIKDFMKFIITFYGWDKQTPDVLSKHRHSFEHRILVGPTMYRVQWLPDEILQTSLNQIDELVNEYSFLNTISERRYLQDIQKLIQKTLSEERNVTETHKNRRNFAAIISELDDIRGEDISIVAPEVYTAYKEYFDAR
jgi:radical SAM protein with 4Fe4S-binding SPASM domain